MKTLLVVIAILAASITVVAQPRPIQLPNLCWVPGTAAHSPALEGTTAFAEDDFQLGWNWAAPFSAVGQRMRARRVHQGDFFLTNGKNSATATDDMQESFHEIYVPSMRFISVVRGMSDNILGGNLTTNPSQSPAVEYSPWMTYNTATSDVVLDPTDHNGCVFGFRTRNGGTRTGNGSDPTSANPQPYRWQWDATATSANPGANTLILDGPSTDSVMLLWWPFTHTDNADLNTRILRVAATLRRTAADGCQNCGNDVILSIRLPYVRGINVLPLNPADRTTDPNVGYIEFNKFPQNGLPPVHNPGTYDGGNGATISVPSGRLSELPALPIPLTQNPTTFEIRRNMLPALGDPDGGEVTIMAEFRCDRRFFSNPTSRNNYTLRENGVKTAGADDISHLGIEVRHNDDAVRGLGVEIRSIRIETPQATKVLFGEFDDQIQKSVNAYVQNVDILLNNPGANGYTTPFQNPADRVRIWRFYGRDEVEMMHWLTFRRINIMLGGTLMTEVAAGMIDKQNHCLQQSVFWQGAGFNASANIASYQYRRGYDLPGGQYVSDLAIHRHAALKFGMENMRIKVDNTKSSILDDPDTFLEWRDKSQGPKPLPINPQLESPLSHYLDDHLNQTGGIAANLEAVMRKHYMHERNMLFGIDATDPTKHVPWIANVWPQSYVRALAGAESTGQNDYHRATFENNRVYSHTEMRLAYWMPTILGCKGLMVYKGQSSTEDGSPLPGNPHTAERSYSNTGELHYRNFETGMVERDLAAYNAATSGRSQDEIISSVDPAVGDDWMVQNHASNLPLYFVNDSSDPLTGFQELLRTLNDGQLPAAQDQRLYIGQRSMRQTYVEYSDRIENIRTILGRTTSTVAQVHPLTNLRLRGWFGKGFSTIEETHPDDPACLSRVFGVTNHALPRLRTRHPRRIRDLGDPATNPGHIDYEPYDSSFVDLTVHSFAADADINSRFVIGVLNRRTDPRMLPPNAVFNTHESAPWTFTTYQDWVDRSSANTNDRYAQRGTRQVTVPFAFEHPDNRYRLLRIRELGGGIDTVIGQDRELTITMLPGEGKLLQVDVLPADDVAHTDSQGPTRGFLDHSTQRKLVHFPQVTGWQMHAEPAPAHLEFNRGSCIPREYGRTINGSTMRYHMVYYRRANPDQPIGIGNPLDVFYQRSTAMPIRSSTDANAVDMGSVVWEDPIRLNDYIVESMNGPDTVVSDSLSRPSCGYPSIVVRYDPSITPPRSRVYVVYACEVDNSSLPNIAIFEAQLDADLPSVEQRAAYRGAQGRSFQIGAARSSPHCATEQRLRYWGTPVINASLLGNYYAWSSYDAGIIYGSKPPAARVFAGQLAGLKVAQGPGTKAQFPTLNTYSRLHIGEDECALAWQEGHVSMDDGQDCSYGDKIYYTQLRRELNQAVAGLHTYGNLTTVPQNLPTFLDNTVALASMPNSGMNVKPSLHRSLTDFDQELYQTPNTRAAVIGLLRHKADRLFWTNRIEAPDRQASRIARRPIDVSEMSPCMVADVAELWAGPIGYIVGNSDLSNVEISAGEGKTSLHVTGVAGASSWLADDTTYVINFNQAAVNPPALLPAYPTPRLWHAAFGWRFMGSNQLLASIDGTQPAPPAAPMPNMSALAYVHRNSIDGRFPHSSTSYSQSIATGTTTFGLTAGRRIFEIMHLNDLQWNYAPTIWRSAEAFFKNDFEESDAARNSSRFFVGFRNDEFDAMLTDVSIDGQRLFALQDPLSGHAPGQPGQRRILVSDWQEVPTAFTLSVSSMNSGDAYDNTLVYIERQSDGAHLPLPVFENDNGQRKPTKKSKDYSWLTIADENERFRLIVECPNNSADVAIDVELDPEITPMPKASRSDAMILDLTRMRTIDREQGEHEVGSIIVHPNPASDVITVVVLDEYRASPSTIEIATIDGRVLVRQEMQTTTAMSVDLNVRDLPAGVYSVGIVGSTSRKHIIVRK